MLVFSIVSVVSLLLGLRPEPSRYLEVQSPGWRVFGVFNAVASGVFGMALILPHRVHLVGPFDRLTGVVLIVSAIGVSAFAFGWQIGRLWRWKLLAILYAAVAARAMGFPFARLMALGIGIRTAHGRWEVPLLLGLIVYLVVMSWGLLRYAGFFEPDAFRSRSFS